MTKKELQELPVGTLLYNGRTEGIIRMDGRDKVIAATNILNKGLELLAG